MHNSPSHYDSPHLRYYGGIFGRISLLAPDAEFVNHARDCEQVLLNVDVRPLDVHVDDQPYRLQTFDAILIRPRQLYALPAHGRSTVSTDTSPGSILIKASCALRAASGLATLPGRSDASQNAIIALDSHARDGAKYLLSELMAADPGAINVREGVQAVFGAIGNAALNSAPVRAVVPASHSREALEARIREDADNVVFGDMNVFRAVSDIAHRYDISERHFFTFFRKATGLTPRAFYNMRRLEMAFAMLLDANRQIADIAYELGFSAPPHFTRFMRANTGWTPTRYRQAIDRTPAQLRPGIEHTMPFEHFAVTEMRRLQ